MASPNSQIEIPLLDSPITQIDLLQIKLQQEITQLENWLKQQQSGEKAENRALTQTIQQLISTRGRLLRTLQQREEEGNS